jgi:hypothetical protein
MSKDLRLLERDDGALTTDDGQRGSSNHLPDRSPTTNIAAVILSRPPESLANLTKARQIMIAGVATANPDVSAMSPDGVGA